MLLNPVTFHTPASLSEALQLYKELDNVKIHAGGTFLLNTLKQLKHKGTKTPENILSLYKINELKGIHREKDNLIIKAMTTIDDIFESPELVDNYAVLKTVCRNISTQPIRNMATLGGNLTCRYTWTEMPAAMIGLRATMHFIGGNDDKEESMDAEAFYQQAAKTDKIFSHVSIPLDKGARFGYRRVKKTPYVDIPMLSLMINTRPQEGAFADTVVSVNNCVAFAQRDRKLEDFLNGKKIDISTVDMSLDHVDEKIYDTRSAEYKKHMFRVSLKNALKDSVENS